MRVGLMRKNCCTYNSSLGQLGGAVYVLSSTSTRIKDIWKIFRREK